MPRLLRPAIPVEVKCRVVLRQLGEMWIDDVIRSNRFVLRDHRKRSLGRLLSEKLTALAELLRCEVKDLRLDHHPALATRKKVFRKGVHVDYVPKANDPEHLIYREAHAHHIKTNVRGDGAQHSDRVLIRKERRRLKKEKGAQPLKRHVAFRGKNKVSRPLCSGNRWPPRGTQKFRGKR